MSGIASCVPSVSSITEITEYFFKCLRHFCFSKNSSLADIMLDLQSNFKSDLWRVFFNDMLLDSAEQNAAEDAMAEIARSMDMRKQYRARSWSEKPGREIDWSRTRMRMLTGDYGKYCNISGGKAADRQLMGGLAAIASQWIQVLEEYQPWGAKERIEKLKLARSSFDAKPIAWSRVLERKLQHRNHEQAIKILLVINRWNGPDYRGETLANGLREIWDKKYKGLWKDDWVNNADWTFEWIIVHRIAIEASKMGWAWRNTPKASDFLLEKNEWQLAIYKGRLRRWGGEFLIQTGDGDEVSDAVRTACENAGLKSNGLMPDIVLEFFKPSSSDSPSCYFIADAKRNAAGHGENYVRASIGKAATYVHAFGNRLQADPKCTLFFWQGVVQVCKQERGANMPEFDKSGAILCLDRGWMDHPYAAERAPLLGHWLEHLFSQAKILALRTASSAPAENAEFT